MENYVKGGNIAHEIGLTDLPFKHLPPDLVWMKVRPGSKMTNLIEYALKSMEEKRCQIWTGMGPSIGKAISCVEIMKRKIPNLHQITKISYNKCEEYWNSKTGELDPIKVVRNIPVLHILLSVEPLDSKTPGFLGYARMLSYILQKKKTPKRGKFGIKENSVHLIKAKFEELTEIRNLHR